MKRVIEWFRGLTGAKLRNKPGGMAWIKGLATGGGADVLNGRAVKTMSVDARGIWIIQPPQDWTATADILCTANGHRAFAGQGVRTTGIGDAHLEPWKDLGSDAQDESLWQRTPSAKHDQAIPAPRIKERA